MHIAAIEYGNRLDLRLSSFVDDPFNVEGDDPLL
jgi:hypothetical protein